MSKGRPSTTLELAPPEKCPNATLRTGPSANLPNCRAYELVTPAQTTVTPVLGISEFIDGNFATPLAAADGESMVFQTEGPLPGPR